MQAQGFDRSKHQGEPRPNIREAIERLAGLSPTMVVTVVRGNGASANLTKEVYIGKDGEDTVLCVKECGCHIHVEWEKACDYILTREDVGHGVAEPVVYLLREDGEPMVRVFYPQKAYADIEALLA